jgi:hypothetical protein
MAKYIESFFWGIIAALGALIVEIIFYIIASFFIDPTGSVLFSQFFIVPQFIIAAACIEEVLKYIIIFKRFSVLPPGKSKLANALMIGLGFFLSELVLILVTRISPAPQFLIEIAIIHVGTAGLIGSILILKNYQKIATFLYTITVAVAFHAIYNILSLERTYINNYFIFFVLGGLIITNFVVFFLTRKIYRQTSA